MSDSDSSVGVVDDPNPPKTKKQNVKESKKRVVTDSGSSVSNQLAAKNKKPKRQLNFDGAEMIPLGGKKFVIVREFNGKLLIDLREYYEKDGSWCPGKKGICLSREQYLELKHSFEEIDEHVNRF